MIKRLKFLNFRSHADSELNLGPINLLVGPTASGKSNIFKGLVLLQNSIHRSLTELFPPGLGEFHWVRSRWAKETDPIEFEVEVELDQAEFAGERACYRLSVADSPNGLYVVSESLQRAAREEVWSPVFQRRSQARRMGEFGTVDPYDPTLLHRVWHDRGVAGDAQTVMFAKAVARSLSSVGYYHLEVSALKELGTGQTAERIDYYGGRLPDFVAWAKSSSDGTYERIYAKLKGLLPDLKEILVTQVGPDRQGLALSFHDHNGHIAAPDLSDGTLLTLGLLSIVEGPVKPRLLSLEEPETGLHPRRLRWLFEQLLELAYPPAGQRGVQVLLTTHSPDLVDLFSDMTDGVLVVELIDGRSRVRRLSEVFRLLHQPEGEKISAGHAWATGLYEGV